MNLHAALVAPDTLRLERLLPGPIERVWSFLIDGDKRARWFAGGPQELRAGAPVDWVFRNCTLSHETEEPAKHAGSEGHHLKGKITRLDPPHLIAFTWGEADVSFSLAPEGNRVRFTIVHRRFTAADRNDIAAGWDVHSAILEDVLNGKPPRGFWSTHEALERAYADILKAPA